MSLHYQVDAEITLNKGKPSLFNITYFSTHSACTTLPILNFKKKSLFISRTIRTLSKAKMYMAHLQGVYSYKTTPPPLFDNGQKELFKEYIK
jgi:hypothetical protein